MRTIKIHQAKIWSDMPDYRRARDGKFYFFTVVTHMRQPILCMDFSIKAMKETILEVRQRLPFEIMAWVILPEHMHAIWELPDDDSAYSVRWALIKKEFTKKTKDRLNTPEPSISRILRYEEKPRFGRDVSGSTK